MATDLIARGLAKKAMEISGSGSGLQGSGKKYSTFVVGNMASGHTATDVDYLCVGDGTENDGLVIQQAIDDLPESGGEILILEGDYYVYPNLESFAGFGVSIYRDSVNIRGVNKHSVRLKLIEIKNEIYDYVFGRGFFITASNFYISDISLVSKQLVNNVAFMSVSGDVNNITVQKVCFKKGWDEESTEDTGEEGSEYEEYENYSCGIYIEGDVAGISVYNNTFINLEEVLFSEGSSEGVVSDIIFNDNIISSATGSSIIFQRTSENMIITGNHIYNSSLTVDNAHSTIISNNLLYGYDYILGLGSNVQNNIIVGNIIVSSMEDGFLGNCISLHGNSSRNIIMSNRLVNGIIRNETNIGTENMIEANISS